MWAMLIRLHAQVIKELLCILRDPKSRLILVAPPIIQLCVFSFAATLEVKNIDMAILNHDAGGASIEFIQQLGSSDLVRHMYMAEDEHDIMVMIDQQRVIAALVLPETFSSDITEGRSGVAQVIIDGRKANAGQITLSYLSVIAAHTSATLQKRVYKDVVNVRHWFNMNLIDQWFVVPSLSGILVTFITLMLTALSIARERELGTFDQLLVSPCTATEIILAKTIPTCIISMFLAMFMMLMGRYLFAIPFTGSVILLLLCLLLFIISLVGIGLMISAVCSTQQQAILGTFSIAVPAILLSGFSTPIHNMPIFLQWVAECIPLKHYLIILEGSFLKALPPSEVFANALPMVIIAFVTLTLATVFVRSKLQ